MQGDDKMVGVYDEAELYCHKCEKRTTHETGWESEEPDALWAKCKVCGFATIRR